MSGELWDRRDGQAIWYDEAPQLQVDASDLGSGMKSIEIRVDGVRSDYIEQTCPNGGCSLSHTYTFPAGDQVGGSHGITVIATDQFGRTSTRRWTVRVFSELDLVTPDPPPADTQPSSTPVGWPLEKDEADEVSDEDLGDPDQGDNCQSVTTETDVCGAPGAGSASFAEPPLRSGTAFSLLTTPATSPTTSPYLLPKGEGYGISDQIGTNFTDQRFKDLGVKRVRLNVPWDAILRAKGVSPCFSGKDAGQQQLVDDWLAAIPRDANGNLALEPLISFEHTQPNSCSPVKAKSASLDDDDVSWYRRAVRAFRSRYPRIVNLTAWNEPDNSTQPFYGSANAFAAGEAWRVLNKECPPTACKVAAGDFLDGALTRNYMSAYKDGAYRHWNEKSPRFWAYHAYYAASHHTLGKLSYFLRVSGVNSGKQPYVWLTEQGGVLRQRVFQRFQSQYDQYCPGGFFSSPPPPGYGADTPTIEREERCGNADLNYLLNNVINGSFTGNDRITRFYLYQLSGDWGWDSGLWDHRTNATRGMYSIYKARTNP